MRPEISAEQRERTSAPVASARPSLARSVYCILGIPIDAVSTRSVVEKIEAAVAERSTFVISTPNLNFLVSSLSDPEFRESVLDSDLCPPDGAPILWIARLLGLPIRERAAGADLLDALQFKAQGRQLRLFLFGGAKGVAGEAAKKINARASYLTCVGTLDPGFCDVGEMSKGHIIEAVNSSGADFLALSLGAKKGQLWLQRNHNRLTIPIRSHLGAAINFQAGIVKRAPETIRALGLEWLWRIKEERYLWTRYRDDGLILLRLLITRVLPLAVLTRWQLFSLRKEEKGLLIRDQQDADSTTISLCGMATESYVPEAILRFQDAVAADKEIIVNLSGTRFIDARFLGLLLTLRKELKSRGAKLRFAAVPPAIKRIFHLNELDFLLTVDTTN
jgi:N-acetylglucosaminyldiphosphoundecaprenol N-acetyl-beta-D-mannosaminyltransferase